jgi:outer membrane protein assembly factor BamB
MSKNKTAIVFALFLMFAMTFSLVALPAANAQETIKVPTYLYINAAPSPVGMGQTVHINLFFTKPAPLLQGGSFILAATRYTNMRINIVNPDGTNTTLGPYTSDTTGGVGGITFTPAKAGNYTLQGTYPGQSLGQTTAGQTYDLNPAMSPAVKIVVQESPIPTYSSPPLPTEYWTRPIYASNYAWGQIGGNWYGLGRPGFDNTGGYDGSGNNFQPYSTAPTTGHILWTKPTSFGGQPGGETTANQMSAYSSTSPLYHDFEPVILNGILYYNWYPAQTDMAGIVAVDLRTGQTLWVKNTTDTLIYGQVVTFHNVEEFGSEALLWTSHLAGFDGMGMFGPIAIYHYNILDPTTGNQIATVTDIPSNIASLFGTSTNALIDSNEPECSGSILIYYVNSTYGPTGAASSLTMWNSSLCLAGPGAVGEEAEIHTGNYKPSGDYNFTTGIQWSVPIPNATPSFNIAAETNQAILLTSYPAAVPGGFANQFGESYATDVAYDSHTGKLLFEPVNQTLTKFDEFDLVAAGDGVYVRHNKDTNQLYGYSLTTGKQLWGPTQLVGNALSHLFASAAIAYGQCYIWDIGGYVNAVNVTNGALAWTYTRGSAGYNTPYGEYPVWVFGTQSIADGMIFLSEGRCYDPPLFPNGEKLAINCTTGKLVWEINGAFQRDVSPIADGEMLGWNGYDRQIYAFGVGPSKTTVTAPNIGVTTATPVTITGTVTDISVGSQQNAVAMNFPNGLPCVSDASMTQFMEAVYEQQPMPTNVTGVPVTISVLDSNNNCYSIGTTTTDASGTYSLTWTPEIDGNFTVIASFAGTQSYYGSSAETHFYASATPTATPPPTPPPASLADMYILPATIGIIIAIAIVGVVLALMLRKR